VYAVLRACLMYWPLTIVGLLATGVFISWSSHPTQVYFSQTDMLFLRPISLRDSNSLTTASDSIIATAGVIQREIDRGQADARTSSAKVTLVDQGIYHGSRVEVPNDGGQWEHWYNRPVLNLQVSGKDPIEVQRRSVAVQQQIVELLNDRQIKAGVPPQNFIRVHPVPASPSVYLISGRPTRAIVASSVLGLSITIALCVTTSKLHNLARHRKGHRMIAIVGFTQLDRRSQSRDFAHRITSSDQPDPQAGRSQFTTVTR
jgi:hypothetical protein